MFRYATIAMRYVWLAGVVAAAACATPGDSAYPSAIPPHSTASELSGAEARDSTFRAVPTRDPTPPADLEPALDRSQTRVASSLEAARSRTLGWVPPLPSQPHWRAILADSHELEGSVSIGRTGSGRLVRGTRLPTEGEHYAVLEAHRDRSTYYGTDELIDLVRDVAGAVAADYPGSMLKVGNLSRRRGGDIRWSHSHNTGRDVDFAFYCRRAEDGERAAPTRLVEFDDRGRSVEPEGWVFDTPRNWALVEALLTHPEVGIQRIFVRRALRARLLSYARSHGADPTIVERAAKVMLQPAGASPHANHFHVRIACSRSDRLAGCLNYGPRWSWVDWHQDDLRARSRALRRALEAHDVETRRAALEELKRIESPYAPEIALIEGRRADRASVRAMALDVATSVAWWSGAAVAEATRWIDAPNTTHDEREDLYEILRRARDPIGHRFALDRLLDSAVAPKERQLAADALRHALLPGLVPVLIEELDRQPPSVRMEIAVVLRRTTGRSESIDWTTAPAKRRHRALRRWRRWWRRHRDTSRRAWMLESLRRRGFEGDNLETIRAVGSLIPLLRGTPEYVSYNANRFLHRITDRWTPLEGWSQSRLYRHWSEWWTIHRRRLADERRASADSPAKTP
jgi:penicillin-insensitive murein endopeptidase